MSESIKNLDNNSLSNYDKMEEYIKSIFCVFNKVNKKAETQKDRKLKMISLVIYNYINYMSKEYNVKLKEINLEELKLEESINLIPIFEYISYNNIELYDFSKIDIADVDVTKKTDLERFVLTHVYYITQMMQ
jgi:hypothetical protein